MKKYILVVVLGLFLTSFQNTPDFDVHEWGAIEYLGGLAVDLLATPPGYDLPEFLIKYEKPRPNIPPECGENCKCAGGNCPKDCSHMNTGHCATKCSGMDCIHKVVKKTVIYFHSDKETKINVNVTFQTGRPTMWFPKQSEVSKDEKRVSWTNLTITPNKPSNPLREPKGSLWWETARDTEGAYVITKEGEAEKFIFYRGDMDKSDPVVKVKLEDKTISLINSSPHKYKGVLVAFDKKLKYIPELNKSMQIDMDSGIIDTKTAMGELENMIKREGLTDKESTAVTKIWAKYFFDRPGLRIIYMMSREYADNLIKLDIEPKPKSIKRAMLAIVNETDSLIKGLINKLGADEPETREKATETLIKLGRPVIPEIEKALKEAKDPEVKTRLERILTEINKKTHLEKDGKWIVEGPHVQLSCRRPTCGNSYYKGICIRCNNEGGLVDTAPKKLCKKCCEEMSICYYCHRKS